MAIERTWWGVGPDALPFANDIVFVVDVVDVVVVVDGGGGDVDVDMATVDDVDVADDKASFAKHCCEMRLMR
jgi:hypothetical protein